MALANIQIAQEAAITKLARDTNNEVVHFDNLLCFWWLNYQFYTQHLQKFKVTFL